MSGSDLLGRREGEVARDAGRHRLIPTWRIEQAVRSSAAVYADAELYGAAADPWPLSGGAALRALRRLRTHLEREGDSALPARAGRRGESRGLNRLPGADTRPAEHVQHHDGVHRRRTHKQRRGAVDFEGRPRPRGPAAPARDLDEPQGGPRSRGRDDDRHRRLLPDRRRRPPRPVSGDRLRPDEIETLLAEGIAEARNFPVFRFFLNDCSTRTQGIDVLGSWRTPSADLTAMWNHTRTDVMDLRTNAIEGATGVRRETVSSYLKRAGLTVRRRGRPPGRPAKPAISSEVSTDSSRAPSPGAGTGDAAPATGKRPGRAPQASACEPYRELIAEALGRGRNAMAIWQDLVDNHGFPAGYTSVRRFVSTLRQHPTVETRAVIRTGPAEEAQVDYGEGPMVRDLASGKYRRTRLFVLTLGYSRKPVRLLVHRSSAQVWAELHERAFRRLGGTVRVVVLDNLRTVIDIKLPTALGHRPFSTVSGAWRVAR